MTTGNSYHVHAHLEIFNDGKPETISDQSGHYPDYDCQYWLHAHDTSGIIHVEAPHKIVPTLATWFAVVKRTTGKAPSITPAAGQKMRVWVNEKPYSGDPLRIPLT